MFGGNYRQNLTWAQANLTPLLLTELQTFLRGHALIGQDSTDNWLSQGPENDGRRLKACPNWARCIDPCSSETPIGRARCIMDWITVEDGTE
jgi:hypothetical protein